ncbi:MAG: hypothetical protein ABGX24_02025 [Aquificota bacterium]|jgi:predicted hydrocarbon binding protein
MNNGIQKELLDDIYGHLKEILGEKGLKLFQRKVEEKNLSTVPEIVFEIASQMEEIYGTKGAYSLLRELGRSVARDLMKNHPKEEWEEIFEKGLNIMGFAQGVKKEPNRACICQCIFYPQFLEPRQLEPIKHPVCWIGWGFVEGFMKALTGAIGVRWKERDFQTQQCWFELVNL